MGVTLYRWKMKRQMNRATVVTITAETTEDMVGATAVLINCCNAACCYN